MKKILLFTWAILIAGIAHAQNFTSFVINPMGNSYVSELTALNNLLIFQGDDGTHGSEVWVSDGTRPGTHMLKDILPGSGSSYPQEFTEYNGKLYFNANDSIHGRELWVTDGTGSGTYMLADILPGKNGANPNEFIAFAGKLFFETEDTAHNQTIYSTDGILSGTQPFKAIDANLDVSLISNGKLYFDGNDGVHGSEPWITDGTIGGTHMLKDINISKVLVNSSGPRSFTFFNGSVYFSAADSLYGDEVWVTNGTEAGTHLLKDIDPVVGQLGGIGSNPTGFNVVNGKLIFIASDNLWISDGTEGGTKQLISGTQPGYASNIHVYKNNAYFFAYDAVNGSALWRTNGAAGGTALFKDLNIHDDLIQQYPIHVYLEFNSNLYFIAEDSTGDNELFVSDGTTSGTQKLVPPGYTTHNSLAYGNFNGFATVGNGFYFSAKYSDTTKLWRYGAAANGVDMVNSNDAVTLFPNPASNDLQIKGLTPAKDIRISVFNILGEEVYSTAVNSPQLSIPTTWFKNGIYFIRMGSGLVKPFLVNH